MKCEEKKPTWGTDLGGSAAAILYVSVSCVLALLNKELLSKYNFKQLFIGGGKIFLEGDFCFWLEEMGSNKR